MKPEPMPPATKQGLHGRAWEVNWEAYRAHLDVAAADDATLAGWIVEAPWAHPLWHSYMVVLVHLRPLPDGRKTLLYREDASHEFWIYALDPDKPRAPAIEGKASAHWLTPVNFAAQLAETSDAAARTRIEGAVDLIIAGELNPDTDAQRQWEALFGNAMIKPEWRALR
jgi:hypothetical protein